MFWIWLFLGFASIATSQKNLVLIGGSLSDDNEVIWNKVIELAGGPGVARMGVVTAASATPVDSAVYYSQMFTQYGAAEVYWIPVHEDNKEANSDPQVVARIQEMTGFFFGGGDQLRIVNSFYNNGREESPALAAIRSTYTTGAVVGGTSAGAACINTPVMVSGGLSYEALLRGAFPLGEETGVDDLTYEPQGGIGFLDAALVDSHFSERGREGRLIRLLSDTRDLPLGTHLGIGLDENTALVITDADTELAKGEVIGVRGVFFADVSVTSPDTESENWGIVDVNTHFLSEGDVTNLTNLEVTYAPWKSNLKGQEGFNKAVTSEDIFNGNRDNPGRTPEYTYVATDLFDSKQSVITWGVTIERNPSFRVWFINDSTSEGYGGTNPRTGEFDFSYHNLRVQIEETMDC